MPLFSGNSADTGQSVYLVPNHLRFEKNLPMATLYAELPPQLCSFVQCPPRVFSSVSRNRLSLRSKVKFQSPTALPNHPKVRDPRLVGGLVKMLGTLYLATIQGSFGRDATRTRCDANFHFIVVLSSPHLPFFGSRIDPKYF